MAKFSERLRARGALWFQGFRAASARGAGHLFNYIGSHVVKPIVFVAALCVGLYFLAPYLGNKIMDIPGAVIERITGPTLPPQQRLTVSERNCYEVAIADDAGFDLEAQAPIARVIKNNADLMTGPAKICPIWQTFRITMAPSQPLSDAGSPRWSGTWRSYLYWFEHQNLIAAEALVDRYEKGDRTMWDERKHPWLKCARWITRAHRRMHAWENQKKMDEETIVVHETREGTKFRCLRT